MGAGDDAEGRMEFEEDGKPLLLLRLGRNLENGVIAVDNLENMERWNGEIIFVGFLFAPSIVVQKLI